MVDFNVKDGQYIAYIKEIGIYCHEHRKVAQITPKWLPPTRIHSSDWCVLSFDEQPFAAPAVRLI